MNLEERLIKRMVFTVLLFMLIVLGLAFFVEPKDERMELADANKPEMSGDKEDYLPQNTLDQEGDIWKKERMGNCYIRIKKETPGTLVSIRDLYREKSLQVIFKGLKSENLRKSSFSWTEDGETFHTSETIKEKDQTNMISAIHITYNKGKMNSDIQGMFTVKLDRIYAQELYEDESCIYVNLKDPHEIYDKILVLDAGHGAEDTGSYSEQHQFDEKDLNLQILLKIKAMLDQEQIKVYYTRLKDEELTLKDRVQLANDLKADFFISIHCNFSTDSGIHGTETIYSDKVNRTAFSSEQLAKILLDELVKTIHTKKREIVNNESILILNRSEVPASIIEIAYISNQDNLALLKEKKNQQLVAEGICLGIKKAYEQKAKGEK